MKFKQSKRLPKDKQRLFYGGYLFLQQLYHFLGLDRICSAISREYKFTYDLDCILSRLLYDRILFLSSKLNTFQESQKFLEQPDFILQHVYRPWTSSVKKMLISNLNCTKTAGLYPEGMTGSSFTTVPTFSFEAWKETMHI